MKDSIAAIVSAATIVLVFGVFASCTYSAQKDYNACVQASPNAEVAALCERAK